MPRKESEFWELVDKSGGPDACWPWKRLAVSRYPQLRWNGERVNGHRLAYRFAIGPIPPGLSVLHHCDNTSCCNPQHLFLGTQIDNMEDRTKKGRHPKGKLTETEVAAARAATGISNRALGELYGISGSHMSRVRRHLTHRYVT